MSRSSPRSESGPETRSVRPPRGRAQTEPTAALAAVFAVVLGLGAYAVVLTDAAPGAPDRSLASPTVERAHDELVTGGVVVPDRLPAAVRAAAPDGYDVNATLRAAGRSWEVGPAPPGTGGAGGGSGTTAADRASRSVAVRLGPGRVRPGTLRVVVWS